MEHESRRFHRCRVIFKALDHDIITVTLKEIVRDTEKQREDEEEEESRLCDKKAEKHTSQ